MALRPTNEIQALLASEKGTAVPPSDLQDERAKAMDYYLGDMTEDLPAPKDGSKAVSSDVADTIEDLMPALMEVFAAGDEVVRFEPVGPEDEQAAEQETDVVNHVFWTENKGFLTLYTFIKDALLQKVGVVKVFWERGENLSRERYEGLDENDLTVMLGKPGVTLVARTEKQGVGQDGQPATVYDVDLDVAYPYGCARVAPVPPEEFGIARRATCLSESPYCYHKTRAAAADLIAQGYDKDVVDELPSATGVDSEEEQARKTVEKDDEASATINREMRQVDVVEHYIRADLDGTGVRLWKAVTAGSGDKLLTKGGQPDLELIEEMPFAALTPFPQPHQFWGRSVADLVMEVQRIKTALIRSWLDNAYLLNNQRLEISESHAGDYTLDDLLTNRPGGIVRTKAPGGLNPIANQPIGPMVEPLLSYMDARREQRSGATKQGMGMDPNALTNTTATASNLLAQAATARVRLIARIFAETGIKDLFLLLHGVLRRHETRELTMRLRNKWVPINPREWKSRSDMTVHVGLGTGSKDQQQAFIQQLIGMQMQALQMQGGPNGPMVGMKNIYNSLKRMVENAGLRSIEPYFNEPPDQMPQPPAPPPSPAELKAQQDMQLAQAKMQQEAQLAQTKLQMEQAKMQMERELRMAEMQQKAQLERERMAAEMQLRREQLMLETQVAATKPDPVRFGGEVG